MIDDAILIDAVRVHPELYNKAHAGFKNPAIKDAAWNTVGETLNALARDCGARWQTLRERFTKEKRQLELATRSGSGASGPTWIHFKSMEFLIPFIRKRKSVDNFSNSIMEDLQDDQPGIFNASNHLVVYHPDSPPALSSSATPQQHSSELPEPSTSTPIPTNYVPPASIDSPISSRPSTPMSSSSTSMPAIGASLPYLGPQGRCKKNKVDNATVLFKETLTNLNRSIVQSQAAEERIQTPPQLDPDACIGKNVEATLRNLPMHLKLQFRRQFRNLLQDAEEALFAYEEEKNNKSSKD